jgi:hypothetical protein
MQKLAVFAALTALVSGVSVSANAETAASPWGARSPAQCPSVQQGRPPSNEQAIQLLRCLKETASQSSGELWLMEDVRVEMGGPTDYAAMYPLITMTGADTTKKVYPIRGSWTWSTCMLRADAARKGNPDLNCREAGVSEATGACWQTTFGDWKCAMNGRTGDSVSPTRPRS